MPVDQEDVERLQANVAGMRLVMDSMLVILQRLEPRSTAALLRQTRLLVGSTERSEGEGNKLAAAMVALEILEDALEPA
jgi:hypothetical protein